MTVLIVAGDSGKRSVLAERFREQGCRVLRAASGLEALAICASADVSSVVVDRALNGMTAPQLEAVLRRALPGVRIELVAEPGRKPVRRTGTAPRVAAAS